MDETSRTDSQVAEALSIERSTYYDRKKEATFLFGISLWGFVIPATITTYQRVSNMGMNENDFFNLVAKNLNNQLTA